MSLRGLLTGRLRLTVTWGATLFWMAYFSAVSAASTSTIDGSTASTSAPTASAPSQIPHLRFDRILTGDGPESERTGSIGPVTSIVQDQQGFMWFAGESGLVRYDVHEFRFYKHDINNPNSIPSSLVHDLLVDHEGYLWLATSEGVSRYNHQRDEFETIGEAPLKDNQKDTHSSGQAGINSRYVISLAIDSRNNLLVGTSLGVNIISLDTKAISTLPFETPKLLGIIRDIFVDNDRNIWIASSQAGLFKYSENYQPLQHWKYSPNDPHSISNDDIASIAEDAHGNIWIGTNGSGLSRLHVKDNRFTHYQHIENNPRSLGGNIVSDILIDNNEKIWIGLDHGGLSLYQPHTDDFSQHHSNANDSTSLISNQVRVLYEDTQDNVWIGNFPTGVHFYDQSKSAFRHIQHQPGNPNSLSDNGILSIFEDSQKTLWIGTENGLNKYHPDKNIFQHFKHDPNDPHSLRYNVVVDIEEDAHGQLWFATWSGGLHRLDSNSERFINYFPDTQNPRSISSPYVWSLESAEEGTLWVGTTEAGGLNRYHPETDDFTVYRRKAGDTSSLIFDEVWSVLLDSQSRLWVGTLNGLDIYRPQTDAFLHLPHIPNNPRSPPGNIIRVLFEDSKRNIWIGTEGKGVAAYHHDTGLFETFNTKDGLADNTVSSIVEDDLGHIWLGTTNGLSRVNTTNHTIQNFYKSDGITGNNHNRDAALKRHDGTLYIGSTNGITVFDPDDILTSTYKYPVVITNLRILNQLSTVHESDSPLTRTIENTQTITLTHQQPVFSLDFSLLNYRAPHRNRYAYQLEGFDQQWNDVGHKRSATYTNLDAGTYTFKVKARSDTKEWSSHHAELQIIILPAPWETSWAYLLYGIIIIGVLATLNHMRIKRIALAKEKILNSHLVKLDKTKDIFLANTSHELRTPLNGIIGIAEDIQDNFKHDINQEVKTRLNIIISAGKRLSNLINDILDYSKMLDSSLTIAPMPVNLSQSVDNIFNLLAPLATPKNITLTNDIVNKNICVLADPNRLDQILLNLVGNGIKYSDGGEVKIYTKHVQDKLEISIEDTGIGIPDEDISNIFDSYSQLDFSEEKTQGGTGLGLAITKKLVELHGGNIHVTSKVHEGSIFSFTLQVLSYEERQAFNKTIDALQQDEARLAPRYHKEKSLDEENHHQKQTSFQANPKRLPADSSTPSVMIIDDDPVNRMILKGILDTHNIASTAFDSGVKAIEHLRETAPTVDIFIMDILMPKLSGFETCRVIRNIDRYHQTPVIFLSANITESDIIESKGSGGNDILQKPINKLVLINKIKTLIIRQKT